MRRAGTGRWLAMQVVASLTAAACVAALFGGSAPIAPPERAVETGKSAHRITHEAAETTVLRFDPQQQAAMASLASFHPTAAPPSPALPAVVATARTAAPKQIAVLPPPRPVFDTPTPAVAPPTAVEKPEGWRIGSVEIPGSSHARRFGDAAWTAGANAVGKVAGLGSLFGL